MNFPFFFLVFQKEEEEEEDGEKRNLKTRRVERIR
jgi:hypothetical protein